MMVQPDRRYSWKKVLTPLLGAASVVGLAATATPARADVVIDPSGQVSVYVDLGLGAPAGFYGGHLELRLLRELGVSAHVGNGMSGVQLGGAVRGYLYTSTLHGSFGAKDFSFVVDLAYSAGLKSTGDSHQFRDGTWHWAQLGVGAVFAPGDSQTGFVFSVMGGVSMLLGGPGDGSAHVDLADMTLFSVSNGSVVGPWMQLSFGWIF